MVYPGPIDPFFFSCYFDPWAPFPPKFWSLSPDKKIDPIHVFTQNFNLDNFVYLQI